MVSVLVSGLSSLGESPDQGHCVVFLRHGKKGGVYLVVNAL